MKRKKRSILFYSEVIVLWLIIVSIPFFIFFEVPQIIYRIKYRDFQDRIINELESTYHRDFKITLFFRVFDILGTSNAMKVKCEEDDIEFFAYPNGESYMDLLWSRQAQESIESEVRKVYSDDDLRMKFKFRSFDNSTKGFQENKVYDMNYQEYLDYAKGIKNSKDALVSDDIYIYIFTDTPINKDIEANKLYLLYKNFVQKNQKVFVNYEYRVKVFYYLSKYKSSPLQEKDFSEILKISIADEVEKKGKLTLEDVINSYKRNEDN